MVRVDTEVLKGCFFKFSDRVFELDAELVFLVAIEV